MMMMKWETIVVGLPGRHPLFPHMSPSHVLVLSCTHYFQALACVAGGIV